MSNDPNSLLASVLTSAFNATPPNQPQTNMQLLSGFVDQMNNLLGHTRNHLTITQRAPQFPHWAAKDFMWTITFVDSEGKVIHDNDSSNPITMQIFSGFGSPSPVRYTDRHGQPHFDSWTDMNSLGTILANVIVDGWLRGHPKMPALKEFADQNSTTVTPGWAIVSPR